MDDAGNGGTGRSVPAVPCALENDDIAVAAIGGERRALRDRRDHRVSDRRTQEVLARIAAAVTGAADEDRAAGHAARINGGARGQMNVPAGDDDGAADGLFGCGRDLARDSRGAAGRGEIDRTAVAALRRGSVELTRNIDRAALGQQLDGALVRDGRSGTARQRRHGTGLDKCLNC
jgi:hypothetical protein